MQISETSGISYCLVRMQYYCGNLILILPLALRSLVNLSLLRNCPPLSPIL